jgi:hypothetical protein
LPFRTEDGIIVPAVTAEQMREVDRIAVEECGLGIPADDGERRLESGTERDGYARWGYG